MGEGIRRLYRQIMEEVLEQQIGSGFDKVPFAEWDRVSTEAHNRYYDRSDRRSGLDDQAMEAAGRRYELVREAFLAGNFDLKAIADPAAGSKPDQSGVF